MKLHVSVPGGGLRALECPDSLPVAELRADVAGGMRPPVSPGRVQLSFAGRELLDGATVGQCALRGYNLQDHVTLTATVSTPLYVYMCRPDGVNEALGVDRASTLAGVARAYNAMVARLEGPQGALGPEVRAPGFEVVVKRGAGPAGGTTMDGEGASAETGVAELQARLGEREGVPADEVLLQFQAAPLTGDLLVHVTPTTSAPPPGAGPHNIARGAAPQPVVLPAPAGRPAAQPFARLAHALLVAPQHAAPASQSSPAAA